MKKILLWLISFFWGLVPLFASDISLLISDINNFHTFGYRFLSEKNEGLFVQGMLLQTNRDSDFAIMGRGFFCVFDVEKNKELFTRLGRFVYVNDFFYTAEGYILKTDLSDEKIMLYEPSTFSKIRTEDGVYFEFDTPEIVEDAWILPKFLETSNVYLPSIIDETLKLINDYDKKKLSHADKGLMDLAICELKKMKDDYVLYEEQLSLDHDDGWSNSYFVDLFQKWSADKNLFKKVDSIMSRKVPLKVIK